MPNSLQDSDAESVECSDVPVLRFLCFVLSPWWPSTSDSVKNLGLGKTGIPVLGLGPIRFRV